MDIINKTQKPLSIPLPGGKKLFLGPGKTGQVSQKALDHPGLVKLLDAGDVETTGEGSTPRKTGEGQPTPAAGARHEGAATKHHSGGDR